MADFARRSIVTYHLDAIDFAITLRFQQADLAQNLPVFAKGETVPINRTGIRHGCYAYILRPNAGYFAHQRRHRHNR
jgi:hypothetical protein